MSSSFAIAEGVAAGWLLLLITARHPKMTINGKSRIRLVIYGLRIMEFIINAGKIDHFSR
jgi:hypothetical protein